MSDLMKLIDVKYNPISFSEWKKDKTDNHQLYWEEVYVPIYNIEYIRIFKEYKLYEYFDLLFKDDEFFIKIHNYMKSVKWTWGGDIIPSIEHLKNTIYELAYSSYDNINKVGSTCSSGGFVVLLSNKTLSVKFEDYYDNHILFSKKIDIIDIRDRKINRILC